MSDIGERIHGGLVKHGHAKRGKMSPEYNIWQNMKARCESQTCHAFHHYGGRGITVCPEWSNDFLAFYRDMGPRPPGLTLDRIQNDGPYSPENCRWATRAEQARNRRTKRTARMISVNGKRMSVADASREFNVPLATICARLRRGWSEERSVCPVP